VLEFVQVGWDIWQGRPQVWRAGGARGSPGPDHGYFLQIRPVMRRKVSGSNGHVETLGVLRILACIHVELLCKSRCSRHLQITVFSTLA